MLGNMKNSELFRGGVSGAIKDRVGLEVAKAGGIIRSGLNSTAIASTAPRKYGPTESHGQVAERDKPPRALDALVASHARSLNGIDSCGNVIRKGYA